MAQATRYGQLTFSDHVEHALREGALWACVCVAVYLALSLMSYSADDPGWSYIGETQVVTNAGGPAGAWFADVAFYLLGFFAYLLPFMLAWSAWTVFRGHGEEPALRVWLLALRWIGFAVILSAGCGYLSLHVGTFGLRLPNGAGGGLGILVSSRMLASFNAPGTDVLLSGALAVSIIVFSGISLLRLLDNFGSLLLRGMDASWLTVVRVTTRQPAAPQPSSTPPATGTDSPPPPIEVPLAPGLPPTLKLLNPSEPPFDGSGKPRPVAVPAPPAAAPVVTPEAVETPAPSLKKTLPLADAAVTPPLAAPADQAAAPRPALKALRPTLELLNAPSHRNLEYSAEQIEDLSCAVEAHLAELGVVVRVVAVYPGPVVTLFELQLPHGVKANKLTGLLPELVQALAVSNLRLVEMTPGNAVIGLEIPNQQRQPVSMRELLAAPEYQEAPAPLTLALGSNISGLPVVVDLARLPHLLLAGIPGAGKLVTLNAMILSLLYKSGPTTLRLILIDRQPPAFTSYAELPHLLTPVIADAPTASWALRWCVDEMERRFRVMAKLGVRNIISYNRQIAEARAAGAMILDPTVAVAAVAGASDAAPRLKHLPYVVVVIAEVVELLQTAELTPAVLAHLAQKARAAGIHLILATAQPAHVALTDDLKANLPTRIALQLASRTDSRLILEQSGAENLLGAGDMLFLAPSNQPQRVHGACVAEDEVARVVDFLKQQLGSWRDQGELPLLPDAATAEPVQEAHDPLFAAAVAHVCGHRRASLPSLQRQFKISYQRAVRMIEDMERLGIIGAAETNGSHRVLAPPPSAE